MQAQKRGGRDERRRIAVLGRSEDGQIRNGGDDRYDRPGESKMMGLPEERSRGDAHRVIKERLPAVLAVGVAWRTGAPLA